MSKTKCVDYETEFGYLLEMLHLIVKVSKKSRSVTSFYQKSNKVENDVISTFFRLSMPTFCTAYTLVLSSEIAGNQQ